MIDKAIEVMESELECVKQNGKCNQSCEECNLIYKCDELVEVYEYVISILKDKKISVKEIMKMIERDVNRLGIINI